MQDMLPLSYNVMAAAIDIKRFNAEGIHYIHESKDEVGTDVGVILSQIMLQISKWMKYLIKN